MATGEDEPQAVVGKVIDTAWIGAFQFLEMFEFGRFARRHGRVPDPVDGDVAGHGGEPGARTFGYALVGPATQRGGKRFLEGVLGQLEVAQVSDQRGKYAAVLPAKRGAYDLRGRAAGNSIDRTHCALDSTENNPAEIGEMANRLRLRGNAVTR